MSEEIFVKKFRCTRCWRDMKKENIWVKLNITRIRSTNPNIRIFDEKHIDSLYLVPWICPCCGLVELHKEEDDGL